MDVVLMMLLLADERMMGMMMLLADERRMMGMMMGMMLLADERMGMMMTGRVISRDAISRHLRPHQLECAGSEERFYVEPGPRCWRQQGIVGAAPGDLRQLARCLHLNRSSPVSRGARTHTHLHIHACTYTHVHTISILMRTSSARLLRHATASFGNHRARAASVGRRELGTKEEEQQPRDSRPIGHNWTASPFTFFPVHFLPCPVPLYVGGGVGCWVQLPAPS